ncbi:collagenase [Clostridium algidicarnis]|uniref:collagenase n=1 Tax=Clostridium algidicarnis TaxID=37659 RepID=UPI00068CABF0|nr:collagenase [Clostridium algidicarnis]
MKKRLLSALVSAALVIQMSTGLNLQTRKVYASPSNHLLADKDLKILSNDVNLKNTQRELEMSKQNQVLLPIDMLLENSEEPESKLPEKSLERNLDRNEEVGRDYSFSELNSLNYDTLVNTLATIQWEQIPGLFEKGAGSTQFFGNKDRVQAIINGLYTRGSQFTEDDDKGIPTLVEVLRAGYYLGFYNSELSYLNTREYKDKCIPALKQIVANPNFKLGTKVQDEVVNSAGALIGNASSDAELVASFTPVMNQFNKNLLENAKIKSKGKAIYSILRGVEYDLGSYIRYENKGVDPLKTKWGGKIDGFINEIEKIALETQINDDTGWLVNNGIFTIATLGKFHSNPKKGVETITKALKLQEYLGEQFFEAVNGINNEYKGIDADGNILDMEKIRTEGESKYYPKTYKFDNNKVVIRAGAAVTEEKVKRLYWASKEVSAQYFRNIGKDQALEDGNADEILSIVIYNSPREYRMNYALNGLNTENGGMYIEQDGTFYTYERTEEESIYTLEELFRHEFTHYLQGRYVVPGLWGGSIHANDRLTWYEEGEAELYAGSSRTEGIKTRKSMVSNLMWRPIEQRYSVAKTLNSSYNDGFEFYSYAYYLMNYFINHDFEKYSKLKDYLMKNDIRGFDQYVQTLKNDYNLNQRYQEFMGKLYNDYDKFTIPLVSDDYIKEHSNRSLQEVKRDIESLGGIKNIKATESKSQFFNTFEVRGTYTGEYYYGELIDIQKMSEVANNYLKALDEKGWSGYKTTTSYFVNWRLDENYHYQFDIVFRGYLSENNGSVEPSKPVAEINGPYSGETGKAISFSSEGSKTENGNIVKYEWNFGDNETSNQKDPTHVYRNEGEYTVTLKIVDAMGMEAVNTAKVSVKKSPNNPNPGPLSNEIEPNNDFENANGPVLNKASIKGSVENGDEDFFYFNVDEKSKIKISLNKLQNDNLTYLLYKEGDLVNYISYPKYVNEDASYSEETLEKGKYYILIYSGNDKKANYDLTWEKIK